MLQTDAMPLFRTRFSIYFNKNYQMHQQMANKMFELKTLFRLGDMYEYLYHLMDNWRITKKEEQQQIIFNFSVPSFSQSMKLSANMFNVLLLFDVIDGFHGVPIFKSVFLESLVNIIMNSFNLKRLKSRSNSHLPRLCKSYFLLYNSERMHANIVFKSIIYRIYKIMSFRGNWMGKIRKSKQ